MLKQCIINANLAKVRTVYHADTSFAMLLSINLVLLGTSGKVINKIKFQVF